MVAVPFLRRESEALVGPVIHDEAAVPRRAARPAP
jgi:hypothetical protein